MAFMLGMIFVVGFAAFVLHNDTERLRKRLNEQIEAQQNLAAKVADLERRVGRSPRADQSE